MAELGFLGAADFGFQKSDPMTDFARGNTQGSKILGPNALKLLVHLSKYICHKKPEACLILATLLVPWF